MNEPSRVSLLAQLLERSQKTPHWQSSGPVSGRPAAVLATLVLPHWHSPLAQAQLLFIKRSSSLRQHSGQIAFPGGVKEEDDHDFLSTAFRESFEEIGLKRENTRLISPLPSAATPSGYALHPFFVATTQQDFELAPEEVESVHKIELSELLQCRVRCEHKVWQEQSHRVIYFDTSSVCVWGVTGRITEYLLQHFFDWRAPNA